VRADYAATGLSLKAHPISILRQILEVQGVVMARDVQDEERFPNRKPVRVAGMVLIRQRPATASGIVFITIEDETGIANLIVRPQVYERHRAAARHSPFVLVKGHVERSGSVVHVQVSRIEALSEPEQSLFVRSRDFH
jgi:error-prone DNA polymerase